MGEDLMKTHPTFTHKRLSISREAELLQSFVRINVDDDDDDAPPKEVDVEAIGRVEESASAAKEPTGERKKSIKDETAANAVTEEVKKKVKRRRRRNNNKREELYCDKDRAAAVNMGSKDIKHSLRIKRKLDRSKQLQIPEEAEPGTFLALGNYEMGRGDLQIALDFISKALELNPAEKSALVARSRCYILMGRPESALEDAETALNIDKHFLRAIYQKAEALYYLGDFEHSLMYFHRGLHIRPDHADFKLGVHKAQKAIENAIGSSCVFSKMLTPKVRSYRTETTSSVSPETDSSKSTKMRARKSRLLRELAPDKEYLDNLVKNPNLKCKFKENDAGIVKTIEETVEYLNARQEFWRQQLPAHLK